MIKHNVKHKCWTDNNTSSLVYFVSEEEALNSSTFIVLLRHASDKELHIPQCCDNLSLIYSCFQTILNLFETRQSLQKQRFFNQSLLVGYSVSGQS